MVAVKGKSTSLSNQPLQENKVVKTAIGAPCFKIYAEPDRVKIRNRDGDNSECKKKSVSLSGRRHQGNENSLKSQFKNSDKIKGKPDSSVKVNIQRKVLADISNARSSFPKPKALNKSKALCVSSKFSTDTWSASSSTSKPLTGEVRTKLTEATGNHHISEKSSENLKDNLRSKIQGCKFISAAISRTSDQMRLPPTRTSLPLPRKVNKANAGDTKEQSIERLERSRGKNGFPVKPRVSRNVGSQSQCWKNRISDGYITMASKGQPDVDGRALSRRSVKPSLKTKTLVINNQRTSSLKSIPGSKRLVADAATSSKTEDYVEKSSSSKQNTSTVNNEPGQDEVCSFCKNNTARTTVDAVANRKSDRRRSFTSILVSKSKSKEDLPNIYDDHNHLEVSEYVDDIYQYYWVMEAEKLPLKGYMEIQTEITPQTRGILINWLIEVHLKFNLMQETLFLMVTLLDQYLSLVNIKKGEIQLVGLTALLLASKYEDFWHPRILDLISVSAESYTRVQMLRMESAFLKTLKFRLNAPTSYVFMLRFLKAAQSSKKFEHLAFYLIELCLVEYEALNYKPSLLCASAIYLARCTMKMAPAWTQLLEKHSHYNESQIRHCAEMILKFQKAAKTGLTKVTYEKYMKLELNRVAAIAPLQVLP